MESRNGKPYAIQNPHGRAIIDHAKRDWGYEFALRDHLGFTRVVLKDHHCDFRDLQHQICIWREACLPKPNLRIGQVNDYYPFGLNYESQAKAQAKDFQFEYTGKERVGQELGLNWQDYSARWIDPGIGRFTTVDPLASSMPAYSAYTYAFNTPLQFIDPTGMAPEKNDCCYGNPNVEFAKMTLRVQQTFGALLDRVSLTLYGRYNTSTTTVGTGNAEVSVQTGTEISLTVRGNLEQVFTYTEGGTPSTDFLSAEVDVSSRASVSAKAPVGPGNHGVSMTVANASDATATETTQASAGASAGGATAKVFVEESKSGGETSTRAGAEVNVTTPSVWGQSLSAGARVTIDEDGK